MGITERPTLIVGVDFGTTFSGQVMHFPLIYEANRHSVAWGLKDRPDDVDLVQSWPGGGNGGSLLVLNSKGKR